MRKPVILPMLIVIAAYPAFAARAFAQTGVVSGRVTNAQGPPEQAAEAELILRATGLRGTTLRGRANSAGEYMIRDVPPGTYTITVSASGFASQSRQISVSNGSIIQADFEVKRASPGAGGGIWNTGTLHRTAAGARVDPDRLSAATRQRAESFWSELAPRRAAELERRLRGMHAQAETGADLHPEWQSVKRAYPELARLSAAIQQELGLVAARGDPAEYKVVIMPVCRMEGDELRCEIILLPCPVCA